jgi:hypothetical protein
MQLKYMYTSNYVFKYLPVNNSYRIINIFFKEEELSYQRFVC